ncbi:sorting nexin-21 [Thalassophryne amazonica]|uniref:sorting nexin-21 n=1 Tax=Thalassophryne amazonica TaxID=390379 RepID=UPI0014712E67|nr:sorting nexin-21 [Thalassophryne amazonica]XP_034027775.1 sorting nexin-21 [Thalassophryne amazonica]
MASRLLGRLKRSLFKDGDGVGPEVEADGGQEGEECEEAELEKEECVTERLGGTLCFDSGGRGTAEDGGGEGSGHDSDSDLLDESTEERLSSTDVSPVSMSPSSCSTSSLLTHQLQESWRTLHRASTGSSTPLQRPLLDDLLFEVTDANVVTDGGSKYVLYTIQVVQADSSNKNTAVITRRYSEFRRLHTVLRRGHGDQVERVCFPRKKLRSNFTAETIATRSRAFEQYLSHLCCIPGLRGALCVRQFFYLSDLQTGQVLIRVGHYREALDPLLNAKRLHQQLGWASSSDNQAQVPNPASSSWFFTLVALLCCFQEVDQLEEACDHCEHALHVLIPPTPSEMPYSTEDKPLPPADKSHLGSQVLWVQVSKPHPLLLPLLRLMVRLSWQTGRDKRQWEELLQQLEEQWVWLDNQHTIKEFLVKHNLLENEEAP